MVGSVLALLVVKILFTSPIAVTKTCKSLGADYYNYTDGSCIMIPTSPIKITAFGAELMCRELIVPEWPYEWRLPKTDTIIKHQMLHDIIDAAGASIGWSLSFFIGLGRAREKIRPVGCIDGEEWRWTWDNSTLNNFSFGGALPWGETPEKCSRCVLSAKNNTTFRWSAVMCNEKLAVRVVCESTNVSKIVNSTSGSTKPTTASKTPAESVTSSFTTAAVLTSDTAENGTNGTTPTGETSVAGDTNLSTTAQNPSVTATPESSITATTAVSPVVVSATTSAKAVSTDTTKTTAVCAPGKQDPHLNSPSHSKGMSPLVWVAICLGVLIVAIVIGLLSVHLTKRRRKRRLSKLGIYRCNSPDSPDEWPEWSEKSEQSDGTERPKSIVKESVKSEKAEPTKKVSQLAAVKKTQEKKLTDSQPKVPIPTVKKPSESRTVKKGKKKKKKTKKTKKLRSGKVIVQKV